MLIDGDLGRALKIASECTDKSGNKYRKSANSLLAQYNRVQIMRTEGTLSDNDYIMRVNKISSSFLTLIDNKEERSSSYLNRIVYFFDYNKKYLLATLFTVVVVFIAYKSKFINNDFDQLTAFVKGTEVGILKNENIEINLSLGNRIFRGDIGSNGRCNFGDIPRSYFGDTITVFLVSDTWVINGQKKFAYSGNSIQIGVVKNPKLGVLKGGVSDFVDQSPLRGALVMINTDTFTHTDSLGRFYIQLPSKYRVDNFGDDYKIMISKTGYMSETHIQSPNIDNYYRLKK